MHEADGLARVLLVDDEPDQLEMYHFALEQAGFTVDDAETGAAAIAQAHDRHPNLIVLDVRLPDMTGWDVCDVLKRDPRTAQIPIVILTAAASATIGQQAADHGCVAHLLKPCYPDDLTQMIRQILAAA